MNKPILAMAAVMGLAIAQPGIAEGFRCGQRIATPDMTVEELLESCGEPTEKTWKSSTSMGRTRAAPATVKRGTVTVETWTYDRGSQVFAMVVTIEDGKIKKMGRVE